MLHGHTRLALSVCVVIVVASSLCINGGTHHSAPLKHPKILYARTILADPPKKKPPKPLPPAPPPKPPKPTLEEWEGAVQPVAIAPASVPIIINIPTTEPVVFLTIDDGWIKPPDAHEWLMSHKLPFSLFLTDNGIKNDYNYFDSLQRSGMTIENHTASHINLTHLTLPQQQAEICGPADRYQATFGKRPALFRPPYGVYNELTRQAAAACGMKAIVLWRAVIDRGAMQFQQPDPHLVPGDIVLMHFSPDMMANLQVFINQAEQDHLKVARLEDWLQ